MTTRVRLLVGTKKGAFILDSDEARRDWSVSAPLCEGWPVHDLIVEPGSGAILAAAGNPWYGPAIWRSEDGGSTWTHSSAGLTYGDGAEPIATVWSLATTPDGGILAGVEPAGLFRSDDRGRDLAPHRGPDQPSRPGRPGARAPAGSSSTRSSPTRPTPTGRGSASRPSACSRRATAGPRGLPATSASAPSSTPRTASRRPASASTSSRWPPASPRRCTSATTAASTAPTTGPRPGRRSPATCRRTSGSRWSPTRATPTPAGSSRSARPTRAATCPRRTPPSGGRTIAGRPGSGRTTGLPTHDAYLSVLREAMARDTLDPVGITFGTSTGQLWHSSDEGRVVADDHRHAARDLGRRGRRPRGLAWRPSSCRARCWRCSPASRSATRWPAGPSAS